MSVTVTPQTAQSWAELHPQQWGLGTFTPRGHAAEGQSGDIPLPDPSSPAVPLPAPRHLRGSRSPQPARSLTRARAHPTCHWGPGESHGSPRGLNTGGRSQHLRDGCGDGQTHPTSHRLSLQQPQLVAKASSPGAACSRGPDPQQGTGEARAGPLPRAASVPARWQRLRAASGSGQRLLFSPCPDPDGAAALPAPSKTTENILHTNSL